MHSVCVEGAISARHPFTNQAFQLIGLAANPAGDASAVAYVVDEVNVERSARQDAP